MVVPEIKNQLQCVTNILPAQGQTLKLYFYTDEWSCISRALIGSGVVCCILLPIMKLTIKYPDIKTIKRLITQIRNLRIPTLTFFMKMVSLIEIILTAETGRCLTESDSHTPGL